MKVDEILTYAFDSSRQWRSFEYKDGVKAVLEFGINKKTPYMRETPGSAAADAFLSGMEEGWALLEHFDIERDSLLTAGEWHCWIEEQRARVIGTLRKTRDPLEEAALVRSLDVLRSVDRQAPRVAVRYPWEDARRTREAATEKSDQSARFGQLSRAADNEGTR